MAYRDADSGRELVLDNRKLLIIFLVFIVILGVAFVLGFIEGKRQGIQQGEQAAVDTARRANPADAQAAAAKPPASEAAAPAAKEDAGDPQMSWYGNLNRKDKGTEGARPAPASPKVSVVEAKHPAKPPKPEDASQSGSTTYSVQAGAFREKSEVETKAKALRSQGYDCRIEAPQSRDGFYLLKVGRYKTRAEAVAMKKRLDKNGTFSIIKTN
jgi:cell division protein FtsN